MQAQTSHTLRIGAAQVERGREGCGESLWPAPVAESTPSLTLLVPVQFSHDWTDVPLGNHIAPRNHTR